MLEGHPAGHHLVGDPAESTGDLDTNVASVLAFEPPSRSQDREVFITFYQIICNHKDRVSQVVIGVSDQRRRRGDRPGRSGTARGTTRPGP